MGALFVASLHPASAATYNYTGGSATTPVSGNFSNGFSPALPNQTTTGTMYSDALTFAGASYTATDDLGISLNLNALTFSNSGVVTLGRGTGTSSNTISLGGTNPSMAVNSNSTGTLAFGLNLVLAADTLISGAGSSATISGVVSGTFGLTKSGVNTLTLSGGNTYSGPTMVSNGSLVAGIASVAGISGAFGNNSAVTFGNALNNGISLVNNGNSYSTQIGSLAGGSASSSITLGAATLTTGSDNTSTAYGGLIGGKGSVIKIGTGIQILTGASNYTGGTTITNGTLSGTTSSTGSTSSFGTGTITDNATLNLGGASGTFANTVSGTGDLTVGGNAANPMAAGAIITMDGLNNNYASGTTVNSGTLSGNAGSFGQGAVTVGLNATVDYTQSTGQSAVTPTAVNNISGAGSVTFGGNTASINGKGGTIIYTGKDSAATTIASGTVILNNSSGSALTGPVSVATGGTLTIKASTNNEIATTATTPTGAAVTLNGGTLNANGSDGAVNDPTHLATTTVKYSMGALALGANGTQASPSVLAFANTGTASSPLVLAFADSSSTFGSGYLNITGYSGTTNALYIGTSNGLTSAQLKQIGFNNVFGATQAGNGEILAPASAPEPSGQVSLLMGMGALGGLIWSRRRKEAGLAASAQGRRCLG